MLRWPVLLALLLLTGAVLAQEVRVRDSRRTTRLDLRELQEGTTEVPGMGSEIPGQDLLEIGRPRHWIGDSAGYAARDLVDSTWSRIGDSDDSTVAGIGVHWLRVHLQPDGSLRGQRLQLGISTKAAFEVFLNGRSLLRANAMAASSGSVSALDSVPYMQVPLSFACDGLMEVIAVRIDGAPGRSLDDAALSLSLHAAEVGYVTQRRMMHFGVFVGINIIILLLALVIWRYETRERSWLLLALLSFVSVLHTVSQVGAELGMLGLSPGAAWFFHVLDLVLLPWPMYLLIMVLGSMGVSISARRTKWYTIAAITVTLMCIALLIAEAAGLAESEEGLAFLNDAPWVLIPGIILVVLFGVIVAWFAVDVVRLGIKLLRTKDHARWIGGGALASSLLSILLKIVGSLAGVGFGGWLMVVGDYCSHVAVPVSVAVYLAIRSAHHNRLVARQRDDLDAEVKERTAQLRHEKERSEELLLNILPHEVAEELKAKGSADARHFDHATVLFTDFKGFTRLSEEVGPAELVQELNACFKVFDAIMERYRIEKIKTIGDSYMAAGGLPDPTHGSAIDVVNAALDMQAFMRTHAAERVAVGRPHFEMRVGIHSGPVVAGIVGVKKFQYDIWGDTVNTASRMESSGEVGQVNISGATYELVKDAVVSSRLSGADGQLTTDNPQLFAFTPRGKVQAKGKGEMEMYFVHRNGDAH